MLTKNEVSDIMDALMIRHWGIVHVNEVLRNAPRHFNVKNSILDAPFNQDITVVAVAFPYSNNEMPAERIGDFGRIEPFAWQFDYHKVVKETLLSLKERIDNKLNRVLINVEYHVDTSPYNDREVAFLAGLGRVGYNHLLINSHYGSYFFIGYLLIKDVIEIENEAYVDSLSLPKDLTHPMCAACKKCLTACPTSVCGIPEVDMKVCLSSLTQTSDEIPLGLRKKFGKTIYGCSLCQKVCPLNHNLSSTQNLTVVSNNWINLFNLLDMDSKLFKESYGAMGFAWKKLWIYQRNALIVLANTGDGHTLKQLRLRSHLEKSPKLSTYYKWSMNTLSKRISEQFETI